MKEQYEYLMDLYGVELIVNPAYASKNNLYSVKLALEHLSNSYIIPCDIWCNQNPYNRNELYSWYMVSDLIDDDSTVRVNRKNELVTVQDGVGGNAMIGICYLEEEDAACVKAKIESLCRDSRYDNSFWEEALYAKDKMTIQARVVSSANVVEINTYEQLRDLDDLRQSVQNAAYEQKDPLVIYKIESYNLFASMLEALDRDVLSFLLRSSIFLREPDPSQAQPAREPEAPKQDMSRMQTQHGDLSTNAGQPKAKMPVHVEKKIGRNDPCPCGSGLKYKNCHGKGLV